MSKRRLLLLVALSLAIGACAKRTAPTSPGDLPAISGPRPLYGNEGGNGGDTLSPENGSAWFLTPVESTERKYVSICFERAPGFRAPERVIRQAISTAVDNWEVYLDFKGIALTDGQRTWMPTVAYMPSVVTNTYASDPAAVPGRCRGNENLQFYFGGTPNVRVEKARSLFRNPLAFAYREDFDLAKGWGRGFIWVAEERHFGAFPKWDEPTLTTIVAHELGHVLGCEHVSGTVMRKDILEFLESLSASGAPLSPFKIQRERELLLSSESDLLRPALSRNGETNVYKSMYDGIFGTTPASSAEDDLLFYGHLDAANDARALSLFWGEPLAAGHTRLFEKVERRAFADHYEYRLTFKDGPSSKAYLVQTPLASLRAFSEAKVFQLAFGNLYKSFEGGASEIFVGQVIALDGKSYPVLVQRNSVSPLAGLAIWFTEGVVNHSLFYPAPQESLWTNLLE